MGEIGDCIFFVGNLIVDFDHIAVLESSVGLVHGSRPHSNDPIMSLRGVERRSNLCFGQFEIASGFALAMTVFESFRVIKTDTT